MSDSDRDPPYLREMFTSQPNFYAALVTVIASAGLSVPFGAPGAMLPLVLFGAGEAIAALFVPSWPGFRARIDHKYRVRRREALRVRLETELRGRVRRQERNWEVYARLQELAAALSTLPVPRGQDTLTARDVERVQDAPGEYLNLWSAALSMRDRRKALDPDELERRIAAVEEDLAAQQGDMISLRRAHTELVDLRDRYTRLESRLAATEAALLSLPDVVEEIYLAMGQGHGLALEGAKLGQAVQRLRAQEDLDQAIEDELGGSALSLEPQRSTPSARASSRRPIPTSNKG